MSQRGHTTHAMEIEVDLFGQYYPYVREEGPSYASGGQPVEAAHVEDADIEAVRFERIERKFVPTYASVDREATPEERAARMSPPVTLGGRIETIVRRFDLLKGLDPAARAIVIANLLEALGDDADDALMSEMGRGE